MLVGCGCGWFLVTCPQIILEAPRVCNWCFEDPLPHWSRCLISERNWHIHHLRNKPQHQLLLSPRKATCLKKFCVILGFGQACSGVDCRYLRMLSRAKSNGLPRATRPWWLAIHDYHLPWHQIILTRQIDAVRFQIICESLNDPSPIPQIEQESRTARVVTVLNRFWQM